MVLHFLLISSLSIFAAAGGGPPSGYPSQGYGGAQNPDMPPQGYGGGGGGSSGSPPNTDVVRKFFHFLGFRVLFVSAFLSHLFFWIIKSRIFLGSTANCMIGSCCPRVAWSYFKGTEAAASGYLPFLVGGLFMHASI